ncbi:MAG: DUF2147 domain-containing protein [Bdellovibrio sp.]|nr:DUF2147 domain-containing protein [Bdellovibrio sp.]
MKKIFLALLFCSPIVVAEEFLPIGTWIVASDDAKVEIYAVAEKLEGKIVWLKTPTNDQGKTSKDDKNPDEALKTREIMGMIFLKDFKKDKDEWSGGTIYDAKSGKTYKANIKLDGKDKLKLRGYVGIPLFGRTEEWKRQY